jgi:hypothetical protein
MMCLNQEAVPGMTRLESVQDGFENRTGNAPRGPVVGSDKNNPFVITDSSDDEEDLTHNFNIFNDQKPLAKLGDEKHGADMDQATTKHGGGEPSLSLDEVIDKALNDFTQIYGTSFKDGILTILRDRELLQSFAARVKKHATAPFRKQVANPHWSKQQVLECYLRATLNTPAVRRQEAISSYFGRRSKRCHLTSLHMSAKVLRCLRKRKERGSLMRWLSSSDESHRRQSTRDDSSMHPQSSHWRVLKR